MRIKKNELMNLVGKKVCIKLFNDEVMEGELVYDQFKKLFTIRNYKSKYGYQVMFRVSHINKIKVLGGIKI